MSSVGSEYVSGDGDGGGKLVVHVAENGRSFEVDCDEGMSVAAVQACLELLSGIPSNVQLLLCGDMKLETNRALSAYKLPCYGRDLFLYNRARLVPDSPPPAPERIEMPEITEPPSPSSSRNPHPLDDAPDPALKALPSYERQFRYHFQKGHSIYGSSQAKFDICRRLLREQKVQEKALETARGNMSHFYQIINQMYMDFMRFFSHQHRCHLDLLTNLDKEVEKLRSCKLHPALQTDSRKCLLDFIKEDGLRKTAENCASSHKQFESKVLQLKTMYSELKYRVDDLLLNKSSIGIREVEHMIKDHQHHLDEQTCIMQSLSKDVNTVKKLVDDCLSCQLSASIRPHDAVSALGPMYDVHHKSHIPKMQACDRAIGKLLEFCRVKKNDMNLFLHNTMQKIASVQSCIRDIRLQLPAFKEAMGRQDELFGDLKIVRRIGPAYRACLAEIVRRKACMKLYMGLAGQLAERLAREREAEVRRRDEFLKAHSPYIPRDILSLMGLFDSPSQCDVNIVPFDTNLLQIDVADIDRYAPEYISALSSKLEKHAATSKDSFATSTSSCQLGQISETSVDTLQKNETEELLEGCDSVEIAGTSKMEVENAWLKAELASAVALICSFNPDISYEYLDDSKVENLLKVNAEKTAEALHLKDEYCKHLQDMIKVKQMQCVSYEKRIQELEQRLSEQYLQVHHVTDEKNASQSSLKNDNYGSVISAGAEGPGPYGSSDPMDEVSCTSAPIDAKEDHLTGQLTKLQEGMDENMAELSALPQLHADALPCSSDASMLDTRRDELLTSVKDGMDSTAKQLLGKTKIGTNGKIDDQLETGSQEVNATEQSNGASKVAEALIAELRDALENKSNEYNETESKLNSALEEVESLRKELEVSLKLLDESQMNCAHLENCLHEAREEAHTNLCAADRRASEYNTLRASAVKIRGLFERLRSCISGSAGVGGFPESLRSLALSLGSSANESEDDIGTELHVCIRVLADKVGYISRQRSEFQERGARAEAAEAHLLKELEGSNELVKNLFAKLKLEKQANKDKISIGRLEVQGIAAFILNSEGHYEAINRNYCNYFLSSESVALFAENLPNKPSYIIGQIVHMEHKVVRAAIPFGEDVVTSDPLDGADISKLPVIGRSTCIGREPTGSICNPYNLPIGSEYFVVTVAMLPDPIQSS
ncbi:Autophagy-related protein 11 [Nymphaea thermarum]|nr:Autophagy-related protein 11 [Nymphaea thermarum]